MLKDAKFSNKFYRDKKLRAVTSFPAASVIYKKSPPVTLNKTSFGVKTLVFESAWLLSKAATTGKSIICYRVGYTTQPEESAPVMCCYADQTRHAGISGVQPPSLNNFGVMSGKFTHLLESKFCTMGLEIAWSLQVEAKAHCLIPHVKDTGKQK